MNTNTTEKKHGMMLHKIKVIDPEKGRWLQFEDSRQEAMQFASQLLLKRPDAVIEISQVSMNIGKRAVLQMFTRIANGSVAGGDTAAFGNGTHVKLTPVDVAGFGMLSGMPGEWLS